MPDDGLSVKERMALWKAKEKETNAAKDSPIPKPRPASVPGKLNSSPFLSKNTSTSPITTSNNTSTSPSINNEKSPSPTTNDVENKSSRPISTPIRRGSVSDRIAALRSGVSSPVIQSKSPIINNTPEIIKKEITSDKNEDIKAVEIKALDIVRCSNSSCKCPDCSSLSIYLSIYYTNKTLYLYLPIFLSIYLIYLSLGTCGVSCTCGISPEVSCDPCNDFKAVMMAKKAAETKPPEDKLAETKAAEIKLAQITAAETKAAEDKAAEEKATKDKLAEVKAAEIKAAETKAAEIKLAEIKASETKAAEDKANALPTPPSPTTTSTSTAKNTTTPEKDNDTINKNTSDNGTKDAEVPKKLTMAEKIARMQANRYLSIYLSI
jgi:hypothetical protein